MLALALKRLALSQGTVPKHCPNGTHQNGTAINALNRPNGTSLSTVPTGHVQDGGTLGTVGPDRTVGTSGTSDDERRCFVCGQPARFGFGVHLRRGLEGRWTCAAHRPHGEGHA